MKKFKFKKGLSICWLSVVLLVFVPRVKVIAQQVNGKYVAHYSNGQLKERGFYKEGIKHKTWYYYSEDGLMERKEKWQNGVMVWQIFYSPKGKVLKTIDKNGKERLAPPCNCSLQKKGPESGPFVVFC